MISLDVQDSPLGGEYKLLNVSVGDTHIHIGNIEVSNLSDIISDLSFQLFVQQMEILGGPSE